MAINQPRILIVDDESDIRSIIKMIIRGEISDAKVSEAENGEEAFLLFKVEPFDLIMLDVDMPKMDGWQTLEKIRGMKDSPNRNAIIVMVTARDSLEDRAKAQKLGANGFVYKPFESQEIARLLMTFKN